MSGKIYLLLPLVAALGLTSLIFVPNESAPREAPRVNNKQLTPSSPDLKLFNAYIYKTERFTTSARTDPRDPSIMFAELRALPTERRLALREQVITHGVVRLESLDLLGLLTPDGHRDFLEQLLSNRRWASQSIKALANLHDPTVVPTVLEHAELVDLNGLRPLGTEEFLEAVLKEHRGHVTPATAYLLGCVGIKAMPDFGESARSGEAEIRRAALQGLEDTKDGNSLALVSEFRDTKLFWNRMGNRHADLGVPAVDFLIGWLHGTPCEQIVAIYALQRIKSNRGVSAVVAAQEMEPFDYNFAREAAKSSREAAIDFTVSRLKNGNPVQRKNAAMMGEILADDRKAPNEARTAVVPGLLIATHDSEKEVRKQACWAAKRYWLKDGDPMSRQIVARLIEMFADPDWEVASEAIGQAVNCPTSEVLEALKKILKLPDAPLSSL